jgi:NADH:ubiquinone oxidoreductase subunit 5 (subunit L)/multisubunit Na+/H+ antiporter MnhA subunit
MSLSHADALLMVTLMSPAVAAAAAVLAPRQPLAARWAARALAGGAAGAVTLGALAFAGTDAGLPGLAVTGFGALVLVLVMGMGATVVGFASRSLRGEPYQRRFAMLGSMLVAAGAALALATDLVVLAVAWVATSFLTVAIIRTGPTLGIEARSLRARRSFAAGDLALVLAVTTLIGATGSTSISSIADAQSGVLALAGVLIVVAAAARSASGPFYRWLPDSLGAPTPSSALLHAGVVNGGAIVLIKLGPAVTGNLPASTLAAIVGGLTCIFAEAVMLTRPDIKGRLAWSTTAQMSFTLLLCGLGLFVAAGLHLVAHGLYKGAMFLGSGIAVRSLVRARTAPPPAAAGQPTARSTTLLSFTATAAAVVGTGLVIDARLSAELAVPLGLAWVAAGRATTAWLRHSVTPAQRVRAVAWGSGLVSLFTVATVALKLSVSPDIAVTDQVLSPAWVVVVLVGLVLVASTRHTNPTGTTPLARAWAHARTTGRPTVAPRFQLPGPLAHRLEPTTPELTGAALNPISGA